MPPSPRLVQDDPKHGSDRAKELWAEFQAEQSRLNDAYSDAIEAKRRGKA